MTRFASERFLRNAGILLAVALLGVSIFRSYRELRRASIAVDGLFIGAALLLLVATFLGTVDLWRRMLIDLGCPLRYREALQVWSFSNLGRYIPGKIWQILGAIAVARGFGVPAGITSAAAIGAMALSVATGMAIGGGLASSEAGFGVSTPMIAIVGLACVAVLVFAPRPAAALVPRAGRGETVHRLLSLRRRTAMRWAAWFAAVWVVQGAAFLLFVRAFGPLEADRWASTVGVFALAYVVGLLAFFSPGGVGVREGALGAMLIVVLGDRSPAHVIALGARLWTLAAECIVLAGAICVRWSDRRERRKCESSG